MIDAEETLDRLTTMLGVDESVLELIEVVCRGHYRTRRHDLTIHKLDDGRIEVGVGERGLPPAVEVFATREAAKAAVRAGLGCDSPDAAGWLSRHLWRRAGLPEGILATARLTSFTATLGDVRGFVADGPGGASFQVVLCRDDADFRLLFRGFGFRRPANARAAAAAAFLDAVLIHGE